MQTTNRIADKSVNVVALVKGGETFVFMYDNDHQAEVLRTFGRFAVRTDLLTFTWYDAALLSSKVRKGCPWIS